MFIIDTFLNTIFIQVKLRTKGYAAVGKSSINILKTGSDRFKSPFFVFEEQVS